jgi:PAS domain S-box-containing protein
MLTEAERRRIAELEAENAQLREGRDLNAKLEQRVAERTAELEQVNQVLQDQIIESIQAQALVQQYADEITDLYNNAPCGYHSLDADGVFTRVNDTELKWLGYSREEVIGKLRMTDLIPPDDLGKFRDGFQSLKTKGAVSNVEGEFVLKDGTHLPIMLNSTAAFDANGNFSHTRSTVFDMSELRKAQNLIMELNQHLEERAEMLESANKELESFSYSVSHDLRAPLRAIDGFSRMVMENYGAGLPEQGQHYLRRVRENTVRMGQLIDDLLDFSRITRRPMSKATISPMKIALEVVAEIREQESEMRAEIIVHEMPACQADGGLARQVYANLIGNAVKFTREKVDPRVEIGIQESEGEIVYYVRDNGVGFDMAYVDKLFGVFQRLHSQRDYDGTGVGLATVQRIIHRHGGRIWAAAAVNEGATFYFTLG